MLLKSRFDDILKYLSFTTLKPPAFKDKFWQVRQMMKEWNENMTRTFSPGWVCCLDESMSIWTSKYTCPGWMYVPRKPHPFGNEYHTICCGLSTVLFQLDLVEGKDRPNELPSLDKNGLGPTTNLLLRMCSSIFASGRVVVLDSGFCVMQGIVELAKRGVYAGAIIKKRRYWPKYVPGFAIIEYLREKTVGATASLTGILDGIKYTIFAMKDADYTSMIMATYGSLQSHESFEVRSRRVPGPNGVIKKKFRYIIPFENHYKYRHCIDDHNNHRHQIPSLESTWGTHRWENRAFAFLLAVTEVNIWLSLRYFVWEKQNSDMKKTTLLKFRTEFARQLVYNSYIEVVGEDEGESRVVGRKSTRVEMMHNDHQLMKCPKYASKYFRGNWLLTNKDPHQRKTCTWPKCNARTRTYCSCSVGLWLCDDHYGEHRYCVEIKRARTEPNSAL